jgi:hypothetical protein
MTKHFGRNLLGIPPSMPHPDLLLCKFTSFLVEVTHA